MTGSAKATIESVLTAVASGDGPAIGASLDEAAATLGMAACIDEVVLPALESVNTEQTPADLEPGRQRMATEAVRAWINWRAAFTVLQPIRQPVLLACGPRDRDVVILEALALVLRTRGLQTRVLGGRIPTGSLVIAIRATSPAAVVVLGETPGGRTQAVASVIAAGQLGYELFFLGSTLAAVRARLPGSYLGATIAAAADRIIAAVTR